MNRRERMKEDLRTRPTIIAKKLHSTRGGKTKSQTLLLACQAASTHVMTDNGANPRKAICSQGLLTSSAGSFLRHFACGPGNCRRFVVPSLLSFFFSLYEYFFFFAFFYSFFVPDSLILSYSPSFSHTRHHILYSFYLFHYFFSRKRFYLHSFLTHSEARRDSRTRADSLPYHGARQIPPVYPLGDDLQIHLPPLG